MSSAISITSGYLRGKDVGASCSSQYPPSYGYAWYVNGWWKGTGTSFSDELDQLYSSVNVTVIVYDEDGIERDSASATFSQEDYYQVSATVSYFEDGVKSQSYTYTGNVLTPTETITKNIQLFQPVNSPGSGYQFNGWDVGAPGDWIDIELKYNGNPYSFYGTWYRPLYVHKVNVTYDLNDGSPTTIKFYDDRPGTYSSSDSEVSVTFDGAPTRTGYRFLYWIVNKNVGNVNANTTLNLIGSVSGEDYTAVAHWEYAFNISASVSFEANGGAYPSGYDNPITKSATTTVPSANVQIDFPSAAIPPTRTQGNTWKFNYWLLEDGRQISASQQNVYVEASVGGKSHTATASWEYKLAGTLNYYIKQKKDGVESFYKQIPGGFWIDTVYSSSTSGTLDVVTASAPNDPPNNEFYSYSTHTPGYKFSGWHTSVSWTGAVGPGEPYTINTDNTIDGASNTLYGLWTYYYIPKVKVNYYINGSLYTSETYYYSSSGSTSSTGNVTFDLKTPGVPPGEQYSFNGWKGTNDRTASNLPTQQTITGDSTIDGVVISVYGWWEQTLYATLSFSAPDEDVDSSTIPLPITRTISSTSSSAKVKIQLPQGPTRVGYNFDKWKIGNVSYNIGAEVELDAIPSPGSNYTASATWIYNPQITSFSITQPQSNKLVTYYSLSANTKWSSYNIIVKFGNEIVYYNTIVFSSKSISNVKLELPTLSYFKQYTIYLAVNFTGDGSTTTKYTESKTLIFNCAPQIWVYATKNGTTEWHKAKPYIYINDTLKWQEAMTFLAVADSQSPIGIKWYPSTL